MTPVHLASLLKDYGPWGLLSLALLALRWMFGKYEASARIDEGRLHAGALSDTAKALAKMQEVQNEQTADIREIKIQIAHRKARQ